MSKHLRVAQLVQQAYQSSSQEFAQWMWRFHVPVVAQKTLELADKFQANVDLAVAGAWLHDFGDAFMYRFDEGHEETSTQQAQIVLTQAGYTDEEIHQVLKAVIAPHSCRDHELPTTLEGKVMATADALAHLTTDFYLQFAWKHLPEGKTYPEFLEWVAEKLHRDYHSKIFFPEVKASVTPRYLALCEVFGVTP